MMKFKKGDKIIIKIGSMFTSSFDGPIDNSNSEPSVIRDCRVYKGKNQYKIKGYVGWWDEDYIEKI